jgi:hypothetical protein
MREAQLSISGATWRKHPFEIGRTYVAAQSFHGCPFLGFSEPEFIAGRTYQLVHIGHSHYDRCPFGAAKAPVMGKRRIV